MISKIQNFVENLSFAFCLIIFLGPILIWAVVLRGQAPIWHPDFDQKLTTRQMGDFSNKNKGDWNLVVKKNALAGSHFVSILSEIKEKKLKNQKN